MPTQPEILLMLRHGQITEAEAVELLKAERLKAPPVREEVAPFYRDGQFISVQKPGKTLDLPLEIPDTKQALQERLQETREELRGQGLSPLAVEEAVGRIAREHETRPPSDEPGILDAALRALTPRVGPLGGKGPSGRQAVQRVAGAVADIVTKPEVMGEIAGGLAGAVTMLPAYFGLVEPERPEQVREAVAKAATRGADPLGARAVAGEASRDAVVNAWEAAGAATGSETIAKSGRFVAEALEPKVDPANPTESTAMYLMRMAGVMSTFTQEGLMRAKLGLVIGPSVEQLLFGTTPELRGFDRAHDAPSPRKFFIQAFEKIESGRGLMDDGQYIAIAHGYGPGTPLYNVMAGIGLAADMLLPWEMPFWKVPAIAGKTTRFAKAVGDALPAEHISRMGLLRDALFDKPVNQAQVLREGLEADYLAGTFDPSELSPRMRETFNLQIPEEVAKLPIEEQANFSFERQVDVLFPEDLLALQRKRGVEARTGAADVRGRTTPADFLSTRATLTQKEKGKIETEFKPDDPDLPIIKLGQSAAPPRGSLLHNLRLVKNEGVRPADALADAFGVPEFDAGKTLKELFLRTALGRPIPLGGAISPQYKAFFDRIQTSAEIIMRQEYGSTNMLPILGNLWVTPAERRRIFRASKPLNAAIRTLDDMELLDDGAIRLTPAVREQWDGFIRQHGLSPLPDGLDLPKRLFTERRDEAVRKMAGEASLARYQLRGLPKWSERAVLALEGLANRMPEAARSAAQGLVRAFFKSDRAMLPETTRQLLDELTRDLSRNGEELRDLLEQIKLEIDAGKIERSPVAVLTELMDRAVDLVSADQMQAALRVRDLLKDATPEQLFQLRDIVLSVERAPRDDWHHIRSNRPDEVADALDRWSKGVQSRMVSMARLVVQAHFLRATGLVQDIAHVVGGHLKAPEAGSTSAQLYGYRLDAEVLMDKLDDASMLRVYDEWFVKGELGGPELEKVLDWVTPIKKYRQAPEEALMNSILIMRAQEKMTKALDRLLAEGLIVHADDPAAAAARDILLHRGTIKSPEGFTYVKYPEHVVHRAANMLQRVGLRFGEPKAFSMVEYGKGNLQLPPDFVRLLRGARDMGVANMSQIGASGPLSRLLQLQKEAVSHGLLIPMAAYVVGNVLSSPLMMLNTIGAANTARAFGTLGDPRNWGLIGNLVMRQVRVSSRIKAAAVGAERVFAPGNVGSNVLMTVDGRVLTLDEISKLAQQHGVSQTRAQFESAPKLLADIQRERPGIVALAARTVNGWQNIVRNLDEGFELFFRNAVFVNGLKRGDTAATAAARARDSLYDYSTLTEMERKWGRFLFTFYTFHRKNVDAFTKALFDNPERVLGQLRFFRDQQQWWGVEEEQTAAMSPLDLMRLVTSKDPGPLYRADGTLDTRSSALLSMTVPFTVPEGMLLLYDLLNLMSAGSMGQGINALGRQAGKPTTDARDIQESLLHITGQTNFLLGVLLEIGFDVSADNYRVDLPSANEVPAWLVEFPVLGSFVDYLLDSPAWVPVYGDKTRTLGRDLISGSDQIGFYAIRAESKAAQRRWRPVRAVFGRMLTQMNTATRVWSNPWWNPDPSPFAPPPPNMVFLQRGVPTKREAVRKLQKDYEEKLLDEREAVGGRVRE